MVERLIMQGAKTFVKTMREFDSDLTLNPKRIPKFGKSQCIQTIDSSSEYQSLAKLLILCCMLDNLRRTLPCAPPRAPPRTPPHVPPRALPLAPLSELLYALSGPDEENRVLALRHDTSRNGADVGDGNVEDLGAVAEDLGPAM
jgi:hypothetical protein